jgi:hypothetical protein
LFQAEPQLPLGIIINLRQKLHIPRLLTPIALLLILLLPLVPQIILPRLIPFIKHIPVLLLQRKENIVILDFLLLLQQLQSDDPLPEVFEVLLDFLQLLLVVFMRFPVQLVLHDFEGHFSESGGEGGVGT